MNKVSTGQENNLHRFPRAISGFDSLSYSVDLIVKVIENDSSRLVFLVHRLPRINHQPVRSPVHRSLAHSNSVTPSASASVARRKKWRPNKVQQLTCVPHWLNQPYGM